MVRVQVKVRSRQHLHELERLVGRNRVYQQGTDLDQYVDLTDRSEADLVIANLAAVRIRARIMPDG